MTIPTLEHTGGPAATASNYDNAIGHLRGFTVALVVAHHAALAYHPYAPPLAASLTAQPRWWQAFPVIDPQRWTGATLLVGFNDIFFMSLMFFLSGLFVWRGLQKRGAADFLRGRLVRLGVPFAISAAMLAPLAYYPAYLQIPQQGSFRQTWLALGQWPAGPAWFLWVLLGFDALAALLFTVARGRTQALLSRVPTRPGRFLLALLGVGALAYIPLSVIVSPMAWSAFGPFTFQTSRILHYLAYFVCGIGVGVVGLDRGLLDAGGTLARRWGRWCLAALVGFVLVSAIVIVVMTAHPLSPGWNALGGAGFVLSCACSCLAFLALFLRFSQSKSKWFGSLAANSFAIYLLHYVFVNWLQYALLPAGLPAFAKFAVVFLGALALSWGTAAALRSSTAVRRFV